MSMGRKAAVLTIPLFMTIACGQSNKASDNMEKQTYSLCPKTSDAPQKLYDQVRGFADQHEARLIDRGSGAQQELTEMGSGVLKRTGGNIVLLTVEKTDEFRISVTNLGLEEKFALTVRSWGGSRTGDPITELMDDLGRFWMIERVNGSVTNDPSC